MITKDKYHSRGSIDAEELTQIIVTLYEVEGRPREDGEARAAEIFKLFDEVRSQAKFSPPPFLIGVEKKKGSLKLCPEI